MTWLFVSTSPDDVTTMPVPAAAPPPYARFVSITTTPVPIGVALPCAYTRPAPAPSVVAATTTAATVRRWNRRSSGPRRGGGDGCVLMGGPSVARSLRLLPCVVPDPPGKQLRVT